MKDNRTKKFAIMKTRIDGVARTQEEKYVNIFYGAPIHNSSYAVSADMLA